MPAGEVQIPMSGGAFIIAAWESVESRVIDRGRIKRAEANGPRSFVVSWDFNG